MKRHRILQYVIYTLLLSVCANSFCAVAQNPALLWVLVPPFAFVALLAGLFLPRVKGVRIRICRHGAVLLHAFLFSLPVWVIYHTVLAFLRRTAQERRE